MRKLELIEHRSRNDVIQVSGEDRGYRAATWTSDPPRPSLSPIRSRMSPRLSIVLLFLLAATSSAQTRTKDVIYMKAGGAAFTMDVLKPARPNKAAVVYL